MKYKTVYLTWLDDYDDDRDLQDYTEFLLEQGYFLEGHVGQWHVLFRKQANVYICNVGTPPLVYEPMSSDNSQLAKNGLFLTVATTSAKGILEGVFDTQHLEVMTEAQFKERHHFAFDFKDFEVVTPDQVKLTEKEMRDEKTN